MSRVELPPLPMHDALRLVDGDVQPTYTADQMRAYGAACAREMQEAAAELCEIDPLLSGDCVANIIRALAVGSGGSGA